MPAQRIAVCGIFMPCPQGSLRIRLRPLTTQTKLSSATGKTTRGRAIMLPSSLRSPSLVSQATAQCNARSVSVGAARGFGMLRNVVAGLVLVTSEGSDCYEYTAGTRSEDFALLSRREVARRHDRAPIAGSSWDSATSAPPRGRADAATRCASIQSRPVPAVYPPNIGALSNVDREPRLRHGSLARLPR